jgi:transposase-like protein
MIEEKITYRCQACESADLIKNGHSGSGKQQYICKACGRRGVINARKSKYSEAEKEQIPNAVLSGLACVAFAVFST